jgi:hypothetical protein
MLGLGSRRLQHHQLAVAFRWFITLFPSRLSRQVVAREGFIINANINANISHVYLFLGPPRPSDSPFVPKQGCFRSWCFFLFRFLLPKTADHGTQPRPPTRMGAGGCVYDRGRRSLLLFASRSARTTNAGSSLPPFFRDWPFPICFPPSESATRRRGTGESAQQDKGGGGGLGPRPRRPSCAVDSDDRDATFGAPLKGEGKRRGSWTPRRCSRSGVIASRRPRAADGAPSGSARPEQVAALSVSRRGDASAGVPRGEAGGDVEDHVAKLKKFVQGAGASSWQVQRPGAPRGAPPRGRRRRRGSSTAGAPRPVATSRPEALSSRPCFFLSAERAAVRLKKKRGAARRQPRKGRRREAGARKTARAALFSIVLVAAERRSW